jgi:hypothetical protein
VYSTRLIGFKELIAKVTAETGLLLLPPRVLHVLVYSTRIVGFKELMAKLTAELALHCKHVFPFHLK